ncbi:MAG: hypothetical protein N2Z76_06080 [Treponemataceae bacterium]|nr:hypothetical protein [Treponemataceae bacterium]
MNCLYNYYNRLTSLIVILLISGGGSALFAQNERVKIDFEHIFGHEALFQVLRDEAFLNPANQLNEKYASGHFFQVIYGDITLSENLFFQIGTRVKWFGWHNGMDTDTIGVNLYGITENDSFDIENWQLTYIWPEAFFSMGIGSLPWTPGPAKQLKAANYFEWLFGEEKNKTLLWSAFTFEQSSIKFVYAPRGPWVPESFLENSPSILPGSSIFYSQGQFFAGSLDIGLFVSWDNDWTTGGWASYMIGTDLLAYGEASYTTKNWMPLLDSSNFTVTMTRKNGIRTMGGILYSLPLIDLSFYFEVMYIGDAYDKKEWENLTQTLSTANSILGPAAAGVRGSVLQHMRWSYMSPWNYALHLRPNSSLFNILKWSYSLRYGILGDFYSRVDLSFKIFEGVEFLFLWDVPFAWGEDIGGRGTEYFLYEQRLKLSIQVTL